MERRRWIARSTLAVLLACLLSACGGKPATRVEDPQPPDAPPPTGEVDFVSFVTELFDGTSDVSEPVDIGDVTFVNVPNDDPTAFDDLLDRFGNR